MSDETEPTTTDEKDTPSSGFDKFKTFFHDFAAWFDSASKIIGGFALLFGIGAVAAGFLWGPRAGESEPQHQPSKEQVVVQSAPVPPMGNGGSETDSSSDSADSSKGVDEAPNDPPTPVAPPPTVPAFRIDTVAKGWHFRIAGGKIDDKSEGFNEVYSVSKGLLVGYTVSVESEFNTKEVRYEATRTELKLSGKVYREKAFGGGGSYKGKISAYFLIPSDGYDASKFDIRIVEPQANQSAEEAKVLIDKEIDRLSKEHRVPK